MASTVTVNGGTRPNQRRRGPRQAKKTLPVHEETTIKVVSHPAPSPTGAARGRSRPRNRNGRQPQRQEQQPRNQIMSRIPRPRQLAMEIANNPNLGIDIRSNVLFLKYLKNLLAPADFPDAPYPDSDLKMTARFTSVMSFDPDVIMTSAGVGKFALLVQPQMGDILQPSHYKIAMSRAPTSTWDETDWSLPTNYASISANFDPRIDINSRFLLASPIDGYTLDTTLTGAAAALAQPLAVTDPQNYTEFNAPANVSLQTQSNVLGTLNVHQNASDGSLSVPSGQWLLQLITRGTSTKALNNVIPVIFPLSAGNSIIQSFPCTANVTGAQAFSACNTYLLNLVRPTPLKFTINASVNGNARINANDLSALTTLIILTSARSPNVAPSSNNGIVQLVRPVSTTVLVSCVAPKNWIGGSIGTCRVDRGIAETAFFGQACGAVGQLQNFEVVKGLAGADDGLFKDGAFAVWTPMDDSDSEFRLPADANASTWRSLVCAGEWTPLNTTGTGWTEGAIANPLRVRVESTFEYTTNCTAVQQNVNCGSRAVIDLVNRSLAGEKLVMCNGTHDSWRKRLFKFFDKNLGTILQTGVSVAGMLL